MQVAHIYWDSWIYALKIFHMSLYINVTSITCKKRVAWFFFYFLFFYSKQIPTEKYPTNRYRQFRQLKFSTLSPSFLFRENHVNILILILSDFLPCLKRCFLIFYNMCLLFLPLSPHSLSSSNFLSTTPCPHSLSFSLSRYMEETLKGPNSSTEC